MKRILLALMFLLMVLPVSANQPTPETECCLYFKDGFDLPDRCNEYEINKEHCDVIVSDWNRLTTDMDKDLMFFGFIELFVTGLAVVGAVALLIWLIRKFRKH